MPPAGHCSIWTPSPPSEQRRAAGPGSSVSTRPRYCCMLCCRRGPPPQGTHATAPREGHWSTATTASWCSLWSASPPLSSPCDLAVCFWPAARAAFTLGVGVSVALFAHGWGRLKLGLVDLGASCLTAGPRSKAARDPTEFEARSFLEHFYCGLLWNPRVLGVDVKMFNYLVGFVLFLRVVVCCKTKLDFLFGVPGCL